MSTIWRAFEGAGVGGRGDGAKPRARGGRRRTASSGVVWSRTASWSRATTQSMPTTRCPWACPTAARSRRASWARSRHRLRPAEGRVSGLVPPRWAEPGARNRAVVLGLSRPGRSARARLGIVSAFASEWRTPAGGRFERYVETDLPLQPGFSGSLLLAADGAALGVNTAGLLRGASLAVPAAACGAWPWPCSRTAASARLPRHRHVPWRCRGLRSTPGRARPARAVRAAGKPGRAAGLLLGDVLLRAGDDVLTHPGARALLDADCVGRELSCASCARASPVR